MKNILFFCAALSLATCFTACKGEQGDPGPAGVAGPAGPQGPAGEGSVKGQTFTVSNWTYADPSWSGTIAYPAITADIVNKGGVFVYWKNVAGNWVALPLTYYPTDWYTTTLQTEHYVGGVKILKTDSDLTEPLSPGDQMFKVVAITGDGRVRNDDLDWSNYKAVSERFGLENE